MKAYRILFAATLILLPLLTQAQPPQAVAGVFPGRAGGHAHPHAACLQRLQKRGGETARYGGGAEGYLLKAVPGRIEIGAKTLRGVKYAMYSLRQAAERDAINTPIQGSAADLIKIAMVKVDRAMKAERFVSDDALPEKDMKFIKK